MNTPSSPLTTSPPWIGSALAGLAAVLVSIGLGRFAYTPLLPALIEAGWFAETDAIYLGAANLAGYLAGAITARAIANAFGTRRTLQLMMLSAAISFAGCIFPLAFLWYFVWRFIAGAAGGALMVLAASHILPGVPPARRGLAGGIIFTGVGLGITASGTLVPALIRIGLAETWAALAILSLIATVATWRAWPADAPRPMAASTSKPTTAHAAFTPVLLSLYAVYGLCAVGLVAHMVFLVDYVARGLGQGIDAGAALWVAFGAGALFGPIATGRLADTVGFKTALRLALAVQAVAVALAVAGDATWFLYASSILVGAAVPGIVPLVVGRAQQLSHGDSTLQRAAWSYATVAFSIGQAIAAYAFSYIFETTGRYDVLFQIGAVAALTALIIDLLTPKGTHT
tara:strand:+ start:75711 stop:76910 length:1200 start_codon:yes stop_codon:yes gene_type:complete